ncbi:MAG: succinate dehydrogenase iron-sulfur subunit [Nitrososphaerota archaeon]|nr:succinate dehydrogenase iron-sulfur subunit [Nitrososphaerota archaeon]
MNGSDEIILRVRRFDGTREWWQSYQIGLTGVTSVLDLLNKVREEKDHTLAFRQSCHMGTCGSCGMVINGRPRLACQTNISELDAGVVNVEPMRNSPVIKDLVVGLDSLIENHKKVKPYIIRGKKEEIFNAPREFKVTQEGTTQFLQFDYCIMCNLCISACPTVTIDPLFLGPQALGQAFRYLADPRDEGWAERLELVDDDHGIWRCHFAGACSYVCPKDVDPAKAIQLMKKELLKKRLLIRRGKKGAEITEPLQPHFTEEKLTAAPPLDFKRGD